jgi:hypothetical protein
MHSKFVAVLTCVSAIGMLTAAPGALANKQTVAYYKFETGPAGAQVVTAKDSGPNHLDAPATGALTYSSELPPRQGGKFSLDATADYDYAGLPDNPLLDLTGNFTVSAWVMPTGSPANAAPGDYIVVKDLTTGFGNCLVSYGIGYDADTGSFSANISGSSDINVPCVSTSSAASFPLGQWHFVSMKYTYSAARKKAVLTLFVDGVKEGQVTAKGYPGIAYANGPFLIGAANYGSGDHDFYRRNFVGYIDDVKITVP